jgi:hypothetical protein
MQHYGLIQEKFKLYAAFDPFEIGDQVVCKIDIMCMDISIFDKKNIIAGVVTFFSDIEISRLFY